MLMQSPDRWHAPREAIDEYVSERKERLRGNRRLNNLQPVNRFLAKAAIVAGAALVPLGMYAKYDVGPERERLSQTHPEIIDIYQANDPSNSDTAVVDMVGLGNLSALETATTLSTYADIGNVWAVQYDNQGIDVDVITHAIAEKVEHDGIKSLVLSGHSMGGDVALQIAERIYTQTDIDLNAVILDCTPPDIYSVKPNEREKGMKMIKYYSIVHAVGGEASRTLRFTAEMVARKQRYMKDGDAILARIDAEAFGEAAKEVYEDKILKKDVASTELIGEQFGQILWGNALHSLDAITDSIEGKEKPAIVYMRPKDPNSDTVVDVSRSQNLVASETDFSDLNLLIVKMDNTGHANPNQSPKEYNTAIHDKIIPFLDRKELEKHEARLAHLAIAQTASQLAILEPDE